MPGNDGEISVDEQNGGDDNKTTTTTTTRKKKKKDVKEIDFENENQLAMPSISKPRKRFIPKIKKKPKSPNRCCSPSSRSGSRKGGCFRVIRPRKTEESSSPTSDPNDESFSHEMLRVMLETNDFCSNECNPHR